MDPERWRRVEDLFHRALDVDYSQRARFIDEQCAGDADLLHEVERWLAADAGTPSRLEGAIRDAVRSLDAGSPSLAGHQGPLLDRIGPYRIVRQIGHGGMGAVYLAERDDDQFRQQVAIKVVRHVIDGPHARARFLQERQTLARLNHPCIARLLDGGATEGGQPFFAMEYVVGQPLIDFCSGRALSVRDRLQLFNMVCAAVQYAHQNLVVHRDIKPANILVTDDGQPKLLDFGIAKLIEEGDAGVAPRTTALLLTPDYASPEQVRGEPVTTATDVYSLGCVLYELLSGNPSHVFSTRTPGELERVVCDVDPEPPSRFAPLDDDLDNIVLKALRKDPSMRYATVEQLSDDLRNYLDGWPVSARPLTLTYRMRKFATRNRTAVAATAAVVSALVIGAGAAMWQARRAAEQQHLAERRAADGRRLANTILFTVEERIRNLSGTIEARRLIMESGIAYLDSLAEEAAGDATLQLELARAYERIGEVQGTGPSNLGQTDAAHASFQRAIALLEPLDDSLDVQRARASVYLKQHMVLQRKAQAAASEGHLRKSLELAGRLFAAHPDDEELYQILSTGFVNRVALETRAGHGEAALDAARQALTLAQGWATTHAGDASDLALATAHERLTVALITVGRLETARGDCQEMVRLRESLATRTPSTGLRVALARAYNVCGDLLASPLDPNLGEPALALRYYRDALAIRQDLLAADPTSVSTSLETAATLFNLAALERDTSPESAMRDMRRAMEITGLTLRAVPGNAEAGHYDALMRAMYATVLKRIGRHQEALSLYPTILELLESMHTKEPARASLSQELAFVYTERGDLLASIGKRKEALDAYRRALALGEQGPPRNFRIAAVLARTYERLRSHYQAAGDRRGACEWTTRLLDFWDEWAREAPGAFTERALARARADFARCS